MNKINHRTTAADARVALASIDEANMTTMKSMKPPLWLVLLCAVALGVKTTAMGLMIQNHLWQGIHWGSYIVGCLSVVSWIVVLRMKGITVKVFDVHIAKMGTVSALLICTLLVSARVIYLHTGNTLFPFTAGFLNTLILAYGLHFGLRLNTKNREGNYGSRPL